MACLKCGGSMFREQFSDPFSDTPDFYGWHCPVCGLILDPLILLNRIHPPHATSRGNRNLKSMGKVGYLRKTSFLRK